MREYLTDRYKTRDADRIVFLIEHFPFATLVPEERPGGGFIFVPVVVDRGDDERIALVGHVDSQNPFLRELDGRRLRALFHGPNAYISPLDYVSNQFPTWNYAVAEAVGTSTLIEDDDEKLAWMLRMIEDLERANGSSYRLDLDDSRVPGQIRSITFFRLEVESMVGTFKFAQEKSTEDRVGARERFLEKATRNLERTLPRLAEDVDARRNGSGELQIDGALGGR
jgi:predicted FMN-binding regulatory protein PaiB